MASNVVPTMGSAIDDRACSPRGVCKCRLSPATTSLQAVHRASIIFLRLCLLYALLFCGLHVSAQAAIPEIRTSYLIQTEGDAPLRSYFEGQFTPFTGLINLGYQKNDVWISLAVRGMADDTPYFAVLRPGLLEHVDFYEVVQTGEQEWGLLPLSDKVSGRSLYRRGLAGRTGLLLRGDTDQSLYMVRIRTSGILLASMELLPEDVFVSQQSQVSVQLGLFLGTSLTLFLFVLFVGSGTSSRFYGQFLAFQTVLVTLVLSMNYVIAPWLRNIGLDMTFSFRVFLPFSMICTGLFNIALLRFFRAPKRWLWVLNGLLLLCLVLLLMQILLGAPAYGRLSIAFFMLHCLISLLALLQLSFQIALYKRLMLLCYAGLVWLSVAAIAVTWFYWAPGGWIYQWPILVVSLLSVLMFITVIYELNLLRNDRQEVKTLLALEQQKRELEHQTNEQNSKLLSMLSHEFKNSLAIVTMELAVLREKGFDLRHARKAIDDLLAIIERCMLLEKSTQQLIEANIEPVSCRDMLDDVLRNHWGRQMVLNDCADEIYAYADENILRIVLTNLVDNACKYGASGKPVRIRISEPDSEPGQAERVEFQISNQVGACGKPDPARLFSKYYRGASVSQLSGSGLGLYLVETLARLMRADVTFSDLGDSVVFHLNLPKAVGLVDDAVQSPCV